MSESKVCVECGKVSPYRCPTCRMHYCSVACCKTHKTKNCQKPPDELEKIENPKLSYLYPTEDTVEIDKLKLLDRNEKLINLLKDSKLRSIISNIDQEPRPEKLLKLYMQDQAFTNFVDTVLSIVEPDDSNSCNVNS